MQPESHHGRTTAVAHVPSTAPRHRAPALTAPIVLAVVFTVAVAARIALNWGSSTPWIAPDEMLYALLGESMWNGRLEVLGAPSGYYGLYPLLPGGLLRLLGPDHARLAALLIQSAIGCSTAIVTYLWARQVASARWSLGVAAAVLALPALNYSAFLMTESVSLLAVTSALFLLWRSFVHPSLTSQIVAAGGVVLASQLRLQALVLVPAAILAVGLFGLAGRGRQAVREQGVLMSGLAALLVAGLMVGALNGSPLGGYSSVLDRPVPAAAALGWTIWHLGALAVMSALVPLAGAAALFLLTFLGKVEETRVQALVALTVAWTSVALVAAGGFVAQNVDHLKERNLSALVPPLLVCLAAWGARGLWSFRGVTVGCACFVSLMTAVMPERVLDFPASRVDAPSFVGLHIASEHISGLAFRGALIAAIAACMLGSWLIARSTLAQRLPVPGLLVLPLALLTLMSVVAAREVQIASDRDREFFLGSGARDWIDRHTASPTLLFDEGSFYWNDYWHHAYWNRRVAGVLAVVPGQATLPGRVDAQLHEDGSITNQLGQQVRSPGLVTSNSITVAGTARAQLVRRDGRSRLLLWDAEQPLRLRYRIRGAPLGRTSSGPFEIDVFDCRRNALRVLIRGSSAPAIVRHTGGASPLKASVVAGRRWTPVWVALRREPGAVMCVAHFEPASMVDIGAMANVDAIGLASDARPGAHRRTSAQRASR